MTVPMPLSPVAAASNAGGTDKLSTELIDRILSLAVAALPTSHPGHWPFSGPCSGRIAPWTVPALLATCTCSSTGLASWAQPTSVSTRPRASRVPPRVGTSRRCSGGWRNSMASASRCRPGCRRRFTSRWLRIWRLADTAT
ncbi:hypothetical protein BCR44DRAFT_311426 [Catenaria anguillulae PL171]|uniref:Uncharacterized protein n=1 Tax=Catenaria anguillulae PL171 TaxID=765915 RepID=A0A1Y2HUR1_9FUNG|nr:hypothetical protein BCR44DRAFT_311426 [Catenaria anguillulae PL171]